METRVERYRKLREEIKHNVTEKETTKTVTSKKVNEALSSKHNKTNKIPVKTMLDAYETYDTNPKAKVDPLKTIKTRKMAYIVASIVVSLILVAATIITGILAFRG